MTPMDHRLAEEEVHVFFVFRLTINCSDGGGTSGKKSDVPLLLITYATLDTQNKDVDFHAGALSFSVGL